LIFKDFAINGNRGSGTNGNSTSGDPRGSSTVWYLGINVTNMDNVYVDGVYFYNTSSYNFRCSNCGNLTITRSYFESVPLDETVLGHGQTDGVHIDGPANDIVIRDSYFHTGDDSVALNAPEGYCGPITRATITNSTFHGSISGARLYSAGAACRSGAIPTVDNVRISNYNGDALVAALVIGLGTPHPLNIPRSITDVEFTNSTVTTPSGIYVDDTIGTFVLDNIKLRGLTNGAMLNAIWTHSEISDLKIRNVSLIRTPSGNTPQAGIFDGTEYHGAAVIDDLDINGFKIEDEGGPYTMLIFLKLQLWLMAGQLGRLFRHHSCTLAPRTEAAIGQVVPENVFGGIQKRLVSDNVGGTTAIFSVQKAANNNRRSFPSPSLISGLIS
jgi:hypothetical protein